MQIFVCITMPYGKSDEDNLNELCVLSDQLSRGSWRNSGLVRYLDNKSNNKVSAIEGISWGSSKMAYYFCLLKVTYGL